MNRQEAIKDRTAEMPQSWRNRYAKATRGRSLKSAVESFCGECTCWDRAYIADCPSEACSLWPYRPFQSEPWKARTKCS